MRRVGLLSILRDPGKTIEEKARALSAAIFRAGYLSEANAHVLDLRPNAEIFAAFAAKYVQGQDFSGVNEARLLTLFGALESICAPTSQNYRGALLWDYYHRPLSPVFEALSEANLQLAIRMVNDGKANSRNFKLCLLHTLKQRMYDGKLEMLSSALFIYEKSELPDIRADAVRYYANICLIPLDRELRHVDGTENFTLTPLLPRRTTP